MFNFSQPSVSMVSTKVPSGGIHKDTSLAVECGEKWKKGKKTSKLDHLETLAGFTLQVAAVRPTQSSLRRHSRAIEELPSD